MTKHNSTYQTPWNDILTERLHLYVLERKSSGQISLLLGVSRSAVISKCKREGLQLGAINGLRSVKKFKPPKRPVLHYKPLRTPESGGNKVVMVPLKVEKHKRYRPQPGNCTITGLFEGICRWPLWDNVLPPTPLYCGAHCDGVYCEEHRQLACKPYMRTG